MNLSIFVICVVVHMIVDLKIFTIWGKSLSKFTFLSAFCNTLKLKIYLFKHFEKQIYCFAITNSPGICSHGLVMQGKQWIVTYEKLLLSNKYTRSFLNIILFKLWFKFSKIFFTINKKENALYNGLYLGISLCDNSVLSLCQHTFSKFCLNSFTLRLDKIKWMLMWKTNLLRL